MSEQEKNVTPDETVVEEPTPEETPVEQTAEAPGEDFEEKYRQEHDSFLRLAAEYDNFRKRSQREKDALYQDAVADTAKKFLPVYDNLLRAMKQETADEAYKKGVEMTLTELVKIMDGLGIHAFGEAGESFDPERHNAVMHTEDESLGENVVAQVFQKGFRLGDRIIRFAMVQAAN